jgi:hypothetical protein
LKLITTGYNDCIESGLKAIAIDEVFNYVVDLFFLSLFPTHKLIHIYIYIYIYIQIYVSKCLSPYIPSHNQALLVAAALANGNLSIALPLTPLAVSAHPLSAVYLSGIFPICRELVLTRFGLWDQILSLPRPSFSTLAPFVEVSALYSHILAHIWSNNSNSIGSSIAFDLYRNFSHVSGNVPKDTLPVTHVFYPYHREIVQLYNLTILAAFFTSKSDHQNAILRISEAIQIQNSFQYMVLHTI